MKAILFYNHGEAGVLHYTDHPVREGCEKVGQGLKLNIPTFLERMALAK
jgi:hypothetical protein